MSLVVLLYLISVVLLVLGAIPACNQKVQIGWLGAALFVFTLALLPVLTR